MSQLQNSPKRRRLTTDSSYDEYNSSPRTSSLRNEKVESNSQFWYYTTADDSVYYLSPVESLSSTSNTNNNANTDGSNDDNANTPLNRDKPFLFSSVKPPLSTAFEGHQYKRYIECVILQNFSTKYKEDDKRLGPKPMLQYVPACVMVQLIVEGNFTVHYNSTENPNDIVLLPKNDACIWAAMETLLSLNVNATARQVITEFPYIPYSHNLPDVHIPEKFDFAFRGHTADVDPLNWRQFVYGVTNYRYRGKTWAANCRHGLSHWDEHPWCVQCLLKAKIPRCIPVHEQEAGKAYEGCYICHQTCHGSGVTLPELPIQYQV